MSPRVADPAVRTALIDAAARLLAAEGPAALSTRRLAAKVGASTMTIYTHFGSMSELHAAVRREGFSRLAAALGTPASDDDPVAGLAAGCLAYLRTAMAEPELYWAMLSHRPPQGEGAGGDDAGGAVFELLRRRVASCLAAGRLPDADPQRSAVWAGELWAAFHGLAVLAVSGTLARDQVELLGADTLFRLFVGFGEEPAVARRSIDAATSALRDQGRRTRANTSSSASEASSRGSAAGGSRSARGS